MEKLDVKYHPGVEYRELFNVTVDSLHCTDTGIGLANGYVEKAIQSGQTTEEELESLRG